MLTRFANRPRRAPLFLTIIVLILIAGFGLAQLRTQTVICHASTGQDCPTEVISQLHSLKGTSLVFSNLFTQTQTKLAAERTNRVKSISKKFPNTLVIELEPQQLLYQVKLLGQPEFLTVSDTGRLIQLGEADNLLTVVVPSEIWTEWQAGGQVEPHIQQALGQVPQLLGQANIQTEAVVLYDPQTIILYLPNNQTAILDLLELPGDLARLSAIQTQLELEPLEQPIEEIDIRYDLPVLRSIRNMPRHQAL